MICGAAASTGKTVIVDDVKSDPRYLACSVETKSEIVVPIFVGGKVVGELDIDSHFLAAFTPEDQELCEYVAALMGKWIESHPKIRYQKGTEMFPGENYARANLFYYAVQFSAERRIFRVADKHDVGILLEMRDCRKLASSWCARLIRSSLTQRLMRLTSVRFTTSDFFCRSAKP